MFASNIQDDKRERNLPDKGDIQREDSNIRNENYKN